MILADAGFWIALANPRDRAHRAAVNAAQKWATQGFVSTWPVLTEASHLIHSRLGSDSLLRFASNLENGICEIFPLPAQVLPRMHALMTQYRDLPMDLADASLVVAAEQLGDGRILSTDTRNFGVYRWKNQQPFQNLLAFD